jgi:hypothetical protein
MRAFAFLVALLSLAMAQAFLAPAGLKAPRVVSDDRETTERDVQETAERGVVVLGCECPCGRAVASWQAGRKRRVMPLFCSSHGEIRRHGTACLIHTERTRPRC